jgi:DNA-binding GntR family transcriptional regulator
MTTCTAKTKIFSEIKRAIILGHTKAGERLDVDYLAARYETCVTPVRDALQMLSQEGLRLYLALVIMSPESPLKSCEI